MLKKEGSKQLGMRAKVSGLERVYKTSESITPKKIAPSTPRDGRVNRRRLTGQLQAIDTSISNGRRACCQKQAHEQNGAGRHRHKKGTPLRTSLTEACLSRAGIIGR